MASLASPASFDEFQSAVKADPSLKAQVQTEKAYFDNFAQGYTRSIEVVGGVIAVLMALGAIGAINVLYTSLTSRAGEMATLRAVGYRRLRVLVASLLEALTSSWLAGFSVVSSRMVSSMAVRPPRSRAACSRWPSSSP